MPPLNIDAPFVTAFKNNEIIDANFSPLQPNNNYIRYHDCDITANKPRQKIGTIKLNDNKNNKQLIPIYSKLENAARKIGGNYVVVTDLIQKFEPTVKNKIVAEVYYVEDLNNYELSFKWSPKRDIELKDYSTMINKNLNQNAITSYLKHDTRLFGGPQDNSVYVELLNEFIRNENYCNNCTPLDIAKENVKFDLIELYQRKMTKAAYWKTFYYLDFSYQYPLLDSLEMKKNKIDAIKNIDQLKIISETVNKEIELLNEYSDKKVMLTYYKTNSTN